MAATACNFASAIDAQQAGHPGACYFASRQPQCSPQSVFRRWHVTTQELLIRHLRAVWPDKRPRVMVDLGSHAGHGVGRNVSDALLWLDHFHDDGSIVIAVDAFEDYALDLQHRFDATLPYRLMQGIRKISVHAAIGTGGGSTGGGATCDAPWLPKNARTRRPCLDLGRMAAYTYEMCTRTDFFDDYERMDRHGASDHVCRISRQRAGLSSSALPLPHSFHRYPVSTRLDQKHMVPMLTVDELVRMHLASPSSQRIDFLKVDFDEPWAVAGASGLRQLVKTRMVAVMVIEIDHRLDRPPSKAIEEINCLAEQFDYAALLKVPCAGNGAWSSAARGNAASGLHPLSQRAAYMPISHRYHASLDPKWGVEEGRGVPCERGGEHCAIQDLLLLDLRLPELRDLIRLGNEECGTAFPQNVTRRWDAAGSTPAAPGGVQQPPPNAPRAPSMSLVGEGEVRRPTLWQNPRPGRARRPMALPDGTLTCRLAKGNGTLCKT